MCLTKIAFSGEWLDVVRKLVVSSDDGVAE